MVQFNQDLIEKVRSAVDIIDIVGRDVKLQQRGRNYVGLCPFHDEKTPSFNVNRQNQLYYCFGCGEGGNVFNYLMKTKNISFPEALQLIAEEVGIELPSISPEQQKIAAKRNQLYKINHLAAQYYYKLLRRKDGKPAREYLKQRQIDMQTAKQFFLGFAANEWNGLVNFLTSADIKPEDAAAAGLIVQRKNDYYDRFRNRIIFPICDAHERFIGFGGRMIGQGEPKYLNCPETQIFQKSRSLYGINWAKDAIKRNDSVVVVEGYTDCIALYMKGVKNVVASLGTAFTSYHAALIAKFTKNVVIAFDSDTAGINAAKRGFGLLTQKGLDVKVAPLPKGMDPDSFAGENTADKVRQWLLDAIPHTEFLIDCIVSKYNIHSREGKIKASQEIINILVSLKSAIEREEYSRYTSKVLGINKEVIDLELETAIKSKNKPGIFPKEGKFSHISSKNRYTIKDLQKKGSVKIPGISSEFLIERNVMRILLTNPSLVTDVQSMGLGKQSFGNQDYNHLFQLLVSGKWDKQGEDIASKLLLLPEPPGQWLEYLQQFQVFTWHRALNKMEEKLTSVENFSESDVFIQLCRLLKQYYVIRREVFLIGK